MRWWPRARGRRLNLLDAALLLSLVLLVAWPLWSLLVASFQEGSPFISSPLTFANYRNSFEDPSTWRLLGNTLLFAGGETALAMFFGVGIALLTERTDVPFKALWRLLTLGLFFVPILVTTVAWSLLLSPRIGVINVLLRSFLPIEGLSVHSLPGLVWVQSLYLVPVAYLFSSAAFKSVNPEMEEAARTSGAFSSRVLRTVTLPVVRPALASAAAVSFVVGLGSIEVPLLLGAPRGVSVLATDLYADMRVRFPPQWGSAATKAMLLVLIGTAVLFVYYTVTKNLTRYVTTGSRGGPTALTLVYLGRLRWVHVLGLSGFFLVALILPLLSVAVTSLLPYSGALSVERLSALTFDNYRGMFDDQILLRALRNSLFLSAGSAVVVAVLGLMVAYRSVRGKGFLPRVTDVVSALPLGIPQIVLALAFVWTFITFPGLYGSIWIMGLAYVAAFIPVTVRQMTAPISQISQEIEEASRVSGAGLISTLRFILVPLVAPAVIGTFLVAFVFFLREFGASLLLYVQGTEVISVAMYNMYSVGDTGGFASLSMLIIFGQYFVVYFLYRRFNARVGV